MVQRPRTTLTAVLDSPDARVLADFYGRLLGWTVGREEPDWVTLKPPVGGAGLSFQTNAAFVEPTWPAGAGDQQMMMHLDIEVDDLDAAGAHAVAAGAVLAEYRPKMTFGSTSTRRGTLSVCGGDDDPSSRQLMPAGEAGHSFLPPRG